MSMARTAWSSPLAGLLLLCLGLPSVARAQSASLAIGDGVGTDACVGVTLTSSGGASVSTLSFAVDFDPTIVTFVSAAAGASAQTAGKNVTSSATAGTVTVVISGQNSAMPDGTIVTLCFAATNVAPDASVTTLEIGTARAADPSSSPVTLHTANGLIEIARLLGDVDGNGAVDAVDVQQVINVAIGAAPYDAKADLDGSGAVDALDVQRAINIAAGLPAIRDVPVAAAPGGSVRLRGVNFGTDPTSVEVEAGGVATTVTAVEDDLLAFDLPAGATSGAIRVGKLLQTISSNAVPLVVVTGSASTLAFDWVEAGGSTQLVETFCVAALTDGGAAFGADYSGAAVFGKGEPHETTLFTTGAGAGHVIARCAPGGGLAWAADAAPDLGRPRGMVTLADSSFLVTGEGSALVHYNSSGGVASSVQLASGGAATMALGLFSDLSFATAGNFSTGATFGPTNPTPVALTPVGNDAFVARYEANSSLRWVAQMGSDGTRTDNAFWLGVAALGDGTTAAAGAFRGTATLGTSTLVAAGTGGGADVVIAKYDTAGSLLWVQQAGGTGDDVANAIAALPDNGVAVGGSFTSTATFGSGPSATTRTALSAQDGFVARYAGDGTLAWVKHLGGAQSVVVAGLCVLPGGEIVISGGGTALGLLRIGVGEPNEVDVPLGDSGAQAFVALLDGSGAVLSARTTMGAGFSSGDALAATPDGSGVILGGNFQATVIFGADELAPKALPFFGTEDGFAAKYFVGR